MLFGMTSSLTFLHRYCLTGTTIAVGTLGWDYDTGSPDPGGVAVYEYNEASDVWDIVGSFLPGTIADGASSGDGGHHVTLSGDGNYLAVVTTGMYPSSPFATFCMFWRMAIGYQRVHFRRPPPLRPRLYPSLRKMV